MDKHAIYKLPAKTCNCLLTKTSCTMSPKQIESLQQTHGNLQFASHLLYKLPRVCCRLPICFVLIVQLVFQQTWTMKCTTNRNKCGFWQTRSLPPLGPFRWWTFLDGAGQSAETRSVWYAYVGLCDMVTRGIDVCASRDILIRRIHRLYNVQRLTNMSSIIAFHCGPANRKPWLRV